VHVIRISSFSHPQTNFDLQYFPGIFPVGDCGWSCSNEVCLEVKHRKWPLETWKAFISSRLGVVVATGPANTSPVHGIKHKALPA
jgi:hypothetical protein